MHPAKSEKGNESERRGGSISCWLVGESYQFWSRCMKPEVYVASFTRDLWYQCFFFFFFAMGWTCNFLVFFCLMKLIIIGFIIFFTSSYIFKKINNFNFWQMFISMALIWDVWPWLVIRFHMYKESSLVDTWRFVWQPTQYGSWFFLLLEYNLSWIMRVFTLRTKDETLVDLWMFLKLLWMECMDLLQFH